MAQIKIFQPETYPKNIGMVRNEIIIYRTIRKMN